MIIGLDVGGTNVDVVAIEKGEIVASEKIPIEREYLSENIFDALRKVIKKNNDIERITISTTHCTNAIVEGNVQSVAMILEPGPGICPSEYFDVDYCRISGYIDHRGTEIAPITEEDINKVRKYVKDYEYIGIAGKFSVRNPSHENYIKDNLIGNFKHITLGHELSGTLNFPRRVNSTYLNSCVHKIYKHFVDSLKSALKEMGISCPVYVLKADGGTMDLEASVRFPLNTILSGPSASIMGVLALTDMDEDAVSLDIGGTTTDISFFIDGVPVYEPNGIEIGGYKTVVKALYSRSIGIGGDSTVRLKDGRLFVGPQRLDKAMALGGKYPTPTDAFNVLGFCNYGDMSKSYKGMEQIAQEMGIDVKTVAYKIYDMVCDAIVSEINRSLEEINNKPVYTVKELISGRKVKPKAVIAVGGPAKAIVDKIASMLNIKPVVPRMYQLANSVGAALSRVTTEITLLADTEKGFMVIPEKGIEKRIDRNFSLREARDIALNILKSQGDGRIIEEQCFNMVRGFYTVGKNIRIKAAIKPGLIDNNRI